MSVVIIHIKMLLKRWHFHNMNLEFFTLINSFQWILFLVFYFYFLLRPWDLQHYSVLSFSHLKFQQQFYHQYPPISTLPEPHACIFERLIFKFSCCGLAFISYLFRCFLLFSNSTSLFYSFWQFYISEEVIFSSFSGFCLSCRS